MDEKIGAGVEGCETIAVGDSPEQMDMTRGPRRAFDGLAGQSVADENKAEVGFAFAGLGEGLDQHRMALFRVKTADRNQRSALRRCAAQREQVLAKILIPQIATEMAPLYPERNRARVSDAKRLKPLGQPLTARHRHVVTGGK